MALNCQKSLEIVEKKTKITHLNRLSKTLPEEWPEEKYEKIFGRKFRSNFFLNSDR